MPGTPLNNGINSFAALSFYLSRKYFRDAFAFVNSSRRELMNVERVELVSRHFLENECKGGGREAIRI